ncbi:glycosyltransferase [Flavobacterium sp.]|uniref:glycosyltransferase n=1 Tax=Flavobacterium sp. TaxID=239 RepID=UPI002606D658|nr:glycosyltransferase [Flavobacterium sp.]
MKILYITPKINNEGGVARVLSEKTNYLITNLGYQVGIITQNDGNNPLFFDFNEKINLFDIKLKGNIFSFMYSYKQQIETVIKNFKPDCIVITDNGLKGFLFNYFVKTTLPVYIEIHGSKYNFQMERKKNTFNNIIFKLHVFLRQKGIKKFSKAIFLSEESKSEWEINNYEVIPNSSWIKTQEFSYCENKKVICIARNSYEKGLDRLFPIWKKVTDKNPDWELLLYSEKEGYFDLDKLILKNDLSKNVRILNFEKNILNSYLESSIYLMTSRDEGMPMVLIEAMSVGLPIIAFDCPIGPKSLIENDVNGFLVKDNDLEDFAHKIIQLIDDIDLRKEFGKNSMLLSRKYNSDDVLTKWKTFFQEVDS